MLLIKQCEGQPANQAGSPASPHEYVSYLISLHTPAPSYVLLINVNYFLHSY
jgi:hypothetical protein